MDLITGKALKAFKTYIKKENCWTSQDFNEHYKCQGNNKYTCADIVDWLDSVGIYVETGVYSCEKDGNIYFSGSFFGKLGGWDSGNFFDYRHQATQEAIKKAVEIYNNRSHEQLKNNR